MILVICRKIFSTLVKLILYNVYFFLWKEEMRELLAPMAAASLPFREDIADSGTGFVRSENGNASYSEFYNLISSNCTIYYFSF